MAKDVGDYIEYYGGPVKACHKEDIEQINAVSWLRHNFPEVLFFHPVNENKKHIHTAMMDEQKGLLKGVSDFIILSGLGKYPFAAIEMKRQGKSQASKVSDEQRAFLKAVRGQGGFAAVTYGFKQFKIAFNDAMSSSQ